MSFLIWQLVDSAFPAGGFAHSYGLEAAYQQGEVHAASLPAFVHDAVAQAGHGVLPFVLAAFDHPPGVGAIDERYDGFLRNAVANRASRVQGRAWLGAVRRAFPAADVLAGTHQHMAPAFGGSLRVLGVSRLDTARMFVFGVARGTLSAAVRLGVVGTNEAQRILAELSEELDRTIRRCSDLAIDHAAQTSPLIDLWQASHDRLYSRLFQS